MYGIYNTWRKQWQFGICEPSKAAALQKLFDKIGKDAYKWRFEAKELKEKELDKMVLKKKTVAKAQHNVKELPKSFVVIDFETTGFDPEADRIIEIGAVRFTEGEPVAILNMMVKQDIIELKPVITETTGHTVEDVLKGIDEATAIELLNRFIDNSPIVGQNVLFDYSFLVKASERHGYDSYMWEDDLYDTLTIGRDRKPYPHRLNNLCAHYGVEQQNWHSAYYDCLSTGNLFLAMHAEDKDYSEGKQCADYKNVISYKRQYAPPKWVPEWVTLKANGNMTIDENKKGAK